MIKAIVLEPRQRPRLVDLPTETLAQLTEMKKLVGGWIELLSVGATHTYINEEGKMLDLPLNEQATAFWKTFGSLVNADYIVGPMIIMGPINNAGCYTKDVSKSLIEYFNLGTK